MTDKIDPDDNRTLQYILDDIEMFCSIEYQKKAWIFPGKYFLEDFDEKFTSFSGKWIDKYNYDACYKLTKNQWLSAALFYDTLRVYNGRSENILDDWQIFLDPVWEMVRKRGRVLLEFFADRRDPPKTPTKRVSPPIEIEKVIEIWQDFYDYRLDRYSLSDRTNKLKRTIEDNLTNQWGELEEEAIDYIGYDKLDPQSFAWEILNLLLSSARYTTNPQVYRCDHAIIMKALTITPENAIEMWKEWDSYWRKEKREKVEFVQYEIDTSLLINGLERYAFEHHDLFFVQKEIIKLIHTVEKKVQKEHPEKLVELVVERNVFYGWNILEYDRDKRIKAWEVAITVLRNEKLHKYLKEIPQESFAYIRSFILASEDLWNWWQQWLMWLDKSFQDAITDQKIFFFFQKYFLFPKTLQFNATPGREKLKNLWKRYCDYEIDVVTLQKAANTLDKEIFERVYQEHFHELEPYFDKKLFEEILHELERWVHIPYDFTVSLHHDTYDKTNPYSIDWEVLRTFQLGVEIYTILGRSDEEAIHAFLNTPEGKELDAWEKWEDYWSRGERKIIKKRAVQAPMEEIKALWQEAKEGKISLETMREKIIDLIKHIKKEEDRKRLEEEEDQQIELMVENIRSYYLENLPATTEEEWKKIIDSIRNPTHVLENS